MGILDYRFRSSIPSLQIPLSNASSAASRLPTHGSGPGRVAIPSLYDSCIRYSMPVYPGSLPRLATPAVCPTRIVGTMELRFLAAGGSRSRGAAGETQRLHLRARPVGATPGGEGQSV